MISLGFIPCWRGAARSCTAPRGTWSQGAASQLLGGTVAGLCALQDHSCCQAGQSRRPRPERRESVESREEKRVAGNCFCWWEGRLLSCECSGAWQPGWHGERAGEGSLRMLSAPRACTVLLCFLLAPSCSLSPTHPCFHVALGMHTQWFPAAALLPGLRAQ